MQYYKAFFMCISIFVCGSNGSMHAMDNSNDAKMLLHSAAQAGDLAEVKRLLELGAGVNDLDKFGRAPLHVAAEYGRIEIIELLIKNGADIDSTDKHGQTPLYRAAEGGDIACLKELVAKGALVNFPSLLGNTPLHKAASHEHLAIVKFLLASGADVNACNNKGETPLLCICDDVELDYYSIPIAVELCTWGGLLARPDVEESKSKVETLLLCMRSTATPEELSNIILKYIPDSYIVPEYRNFLCKHMLKDACRLVKTWVKCLEEQSKKCNRQTCYGLERMIKSDFGPYLAKCRKLKWQSKNGVVGLIESEWSRYDIVRDMHNAWTNRFFLEKAKNSQS